MNIAITLSNNHLESMVPPYFSEAQFLLIYDVDLMKVVCELEGVNQSNKPIFFAKKILEWNCEAVICGEIEKEAFLIIADEGQVTRFSGIGLSGKAAIEKMKMNQLSYIVDFIGGTGCND